MLRQLSLMAVAAAAFGCKGNRAGSTTDTTSATASGDIARAIGRNPGVAVKMRDAAARDLGTLRITETPAGLSISGMLRGLPPGPHAIHIHTVGMCQPPFESAGAHWNPMNRQHGLENPLGPHMGDLANISVAKDSSVSIDVSTPGGTLRGPNPVLDTDGAAVVIHAGPDDNRTDPSGNSGARIACGVVKSA